MHCSGTSWSPVRIVHLLVLAGPCLLGACTGPVAELRADLVSTSSAASLRALAPVDARVCWASGSGGTVLRTEDGGTTWLVVGPRGSEGLDLRCLVAWDAHRAVAASAGQPARILRTADGGATWDLVHEETDAEAFFDSMARDGEHLVLFGDPVGGSLFVLLGADGGARWQRLEIGVLPLPGEAGFAASNSLVLTGPGGAAWIATGGAAGSRLLVRDASGRLTASELPLARGAASRGAFALATDGRGRMVVVGGDHADPAAAAGTAAFSTDGGRNWSPSNALGYRSGLAWCEALACFLAVGPEGCSTSSDGGRSWQPCDLPGFHVVRAASDGSLWAAGSSGRIARIRAIR